MLLCGGGLLFPLFCENGKWVIAAQKFVPDLSIASDVVNDKTAELIPADILEKIGYSAMRNVYPDERFERTKYKLRTERQSLFLQLSAEYKKRDALVLSNYSDMKLKSAIKESEKKIKDIQKKIDANLAEQKKASDENEKQMAQVDQALKSMNEKESEFDRYKNLFRRMFVHDESIIQQEQISFYKDDYTSLFSFSDQLKELSVTDPLCEKAVVNAGINTLITGRFSKYGEYISVYVDLYSFPGAKRIGSVAEVGSVNDLELINTSIVMQIIPILVNSLPVQLEIAISPEEAEAKTMVFIDNVLQKLENGKIIVDSGINTIQFVSEGYKSATTTYNFESNKKYKIEVNFEKPKTGYIQVGLRKPLEGNLLMNGERAIDIDGKKSQISINGNAILGEFISENGDTAFFYIPEKMVYDGNYVTIKPKPMDRMAYIDKRRKIMYGTYSVFILSLIPTFYAYGNYQNYVNLYKNYQVDTKTARNWQNATNVTRFISIGCGVLWGYELVRYLIAANSVLPQNARDGDDALFEFVDPQTLNEKAAEEENAKSENNIENTTEEKNGDINNEAIIR
jgi:hypothetical protein